MKTTINTSLSARIKRRNAAGFKGLGSHARFDDKSQMGDYRDLNQNDKVIDRYLSDRKKSILGFRHATGNNRLMRKKYANNKQAW